MGTVQWIGEISTTYGYVASVCVYINICACLPACQPARVCKQVCVCVCLQLSIHGLRCVRVLCEWVAQSKHCIVEWTEQGRPSEWIGWKWKTLVWGCAVAIVVCDVTQIAVAKNIEQCTLKLPYVTVIYLFVWTIYHSMILCARRFIYVFYVLSLVTVLRISANLNEIVQWRFVCLCPNVCLKWNLPERNVCMSFTKFNDNHPKSNADAIAWLIERCSISFSLRLDLPSCNTCFIISRYMEMEICEKENRI